MKGNQERKGRDGKWHLPVSSEDLLTAGRATPSDLFSSSSFFAERIPLSLIDGVAASPFLGGIKISAQL